MTADSLPALLADADACVDSAISAVGKCIVLALPLGLGKANLVANAFYLRACHDPELTLHIVTALSLELPSTHDTLAKRFSEPLVARLYADVPELLYAQARRRGELPDNIQVSEFFFNPGQLLANTSAQQHYISSNYTHAVRDLHATGVNVLAQMLAPHPSDASLYSLSCNTDLTADLIDYAKAKQQRLFCIGELNRQLPYMVNGGQKSISAFDCMFEAYPERAGYPLFAVPNQPVSLSHYAIALQVSSLVADGGTLQIGIGSLGDAIAAMIALRQTDNTRYCQLHDELIAHFDGNGSTQTPRHTARFAQGLYAASEMLVEGLLHLRSNGVLTRTVDDGIYCHAGFFVGSANFYHKLRGLSANDQHGISMSRISFINHLYHDEALKRKQRQQARFVNSAMMVTLTGAVISDALSEHQVVSGVGGQYNFIAQAHELDGARSIICLPSTRVSGGKLQSNILWEYTHETIPRHLRDMVVTEYGVADLRGQSDRDVIVRMLAITDARFQPQLLARAQQAGKVELTFELPSAWQKNTPTTLATIFIQAQHLPVLSHFPLGNDFTDEEAIIAVALHYLKNHQRQLQLIQLTIYGWRQRRRITRQWPQLLQRMGLAKAQTIRDKVYRYLLLGVVARAMDDGRPITQN